MSIFHAEKSRDAGVVFLKMSLGSHFYSESTSTLIKEKKPRVMSTYRNGKLET